MSELWETLTTGLVLSLLFIGVSYLFWRRYDQPTPLMIERQEERDRLKEERKTWREVESRMRAEQEEAELKASYERRKAEERARSVVPASTEVKDAWKSLGVAAPTEPTTFEAKGEDANADLRPLDQTALSETVASDDDVLNAAELVQVRQDQGVQPGAEEPDWELIEKLEEIASKDEVVLPDVPEAPDLDAVAAQPSEAPPPSESDPDHIAQSDDGSASEDLGPADERQTDESPTDESQVDEGSTEESPTDESLTDKSPTGEKSTEEGTSSTEDADAPSWNLEDGEDLWGEAAW
ncbi:MAG: hypothetical protein VXA43_02300 [Candidatus Poseidoniales archaeon]